MEQSLTAGQQVHGFEVINTVSLPELDAAGIFMRHTQSGAELFHVLNSDEENLFAFAFLTAPEDSTGVAHIVEHSVLCGSQKYPLKDAFLTLAQGSLQTYLNAWTFPDKTVYPASSVNERDYFNLMGVYADAVFHPLLSEWTFMQEGWRLECDEHKNLVPTGVVYNEMKGAYSSPETYADSAPSRILLEGTPYAHESGGDPDHIMDLTYEAFKDFHKTRYAPANCRIFLAGNIPTEKQCAFLDEILSKIPKGKASTDLPLAPQWEQPCYKRVPCPAGSEDKAAVLLAWLCGDGRDADEIMRLATLTEILFGHHGSPLNRALVESKLGEDLSPASGYQDELRQTLFIAGLRGVDMADHSAQEIENFILHELRTLADNGIPPEEIEAALVSMEFSNREIKRVGGPFSLVWMQKALRGWLHGTKPWETLLFLPAFNKMKADAAADTRFFEKLIRKYFLDNPHRALISVEPQADFLSNKETALKEKLTKQQESLSKDELKAIGKKAKELEKIQEAKDSPEALAAIPHLSRSDLSPDISVIPRTFFAADAAPLMAHELFTNGVTYANIAVPADALDIADYPWLTLFSRAATSVGLPGMDYAVLSSLLARTVGDFSGFPRSGILAPGATNSATLPFGTFDLRGRDWFFWNFRCLDEKFPKAAALVRDIITSADFSDHRRLGDLVLNFKNDAAASIAPDGSSYAAGRAGACLSQRLAIEELWNGISQLEFVKRLTDMKTGEIAENLTRIRDKLLGAGLFANITASTEAVHAALPVITDVFAPFGAPKPRQERDISTFLKNIEKTEVWKHAALQVGFASTVFPCAEYASREFAAGIVLAHYASTGELWETIRMKGGAYGAFAYISGLEKTFTLASYRDPAPLKTLKAFQSALKKIGKHGIDEESFEKALIGTYAKETRPQTPAQKGITDCLRFLAGIEDERRAEIRRHLLSVTAEETAREASRLAAAAEASLTASCVLEGSTGSHGAEKTAAALGCTERTLPV